MKNYPIIAVVEIPTGSNIKYEKDKIDSGFIIDRIVPYPYPTNYGFIQDTLSTDGDPIDIFIISDVKLKLGTKVTVDIVGGIGLTDGGISDPKLIGVIPGENLNIDLKNYSYNLISFLSKYKEGVFVESTLMSKEEALDLLRGARDRFYE